MTDVTGDGTKESRWVFTTRGGPSQALSSTASTPTRLRPSAA